MIPVIWCHNFVSQDVFQPEAEPQAFCCSQGKLLIAAEDNSIKLHNLDSRGKVLHSFFSIDHVSQMIFCNSGNYIATLEKKTSKHSKAVTYVRVYFNWWIDARGQPVKVRKAATSSDLCSDSWNDHFQVLELPLNNTAECIACCKTTAALAVSLGNIISVFCYNAKTLDASKHQQHDFSHFVDIEVKFSVQELNICKNYIACMSNYQVQVLKVSVEKEDIFEENKTDKPKLTTDNLDSHFVEWRFESCGGMQWENDLKKILHPNSFPINVSFRAIEKENLKCCTPRNCEIVGPILTVMGYKTKVKLDPAAFDLWPSLSSTNIECVTLLYREFSFQEKNEKLTSLNLVSFYEADNYDQKLDPLHAAAEASQESFSSLPWSSSNLNARPQMKAIGCFFSNTKEGFLYDVTEEIVCIGTYSYTAKMRTAVLDCTFLYALTDAGLETYSLNLSNCAFQYVENLDGVNNTCPEPTSPVCLLGLRPFPGATKLGVSENHVIVVSSLEESEQTLNSDDENNSTLYVLKKPSPQQMFLDMVGMTDVYKTVSPSTYLIILKLSHMILRTHLYLCRNYDPEAKELYLKSCLLLGDYYACSLNPSENCLATPYYNLSGLPVVDIIQRMFGLHNQVKQSSVLKALVIYINSVVLSGPSFAAESFPKALAEHILDIYMEESPENLWKVIICSGMTTYKIEKAMLMLKRRITSKRQQLQLGASIAGDTIALVSLLLKKGNTDAAQNMYLSITKTDIVNALDGFNYLLWSESGLTDLGKFTRQVRPDAFVEVLRQMVKTDKMKVDTIIEMLQQDEPSVATHNVLQLKEFLEAVWNDSETNPKLGVECQKLLVEIYLTRLTESTTSVTVTKSSVTLGARYQWLNGMPPFNGKSITRTCTISQKEDESKNAENIAPVCHCFHCREDLLKLQCFLIHKKITSELKSHVLEFLRNSEADIIGKLSIEVLCLNEDDAVEKLMDCYPTALFQYACDTFKNNQEKWCKMFSKLLKKKDAISEDDPKYEATCQAFHKILSHLSEILSLPTLISLLPQEQIKESYASYVKRCCEKEQSRQLKKKIVALGNEIKAMM